MILGITLLGFSLFFITGCSSPKEIIKDKTVEVNVPELKIKAIEAKPVNVDSLLQNYIDSLATDSSFYEAEKVTEKGDSIKIKFHLKSKETGKPKVDVEVKPAPVQYTYTDTTSIVKESRSLGDYLIYLIVLAIVVAVIIVIIKFKK